MHISELLDDAARKLEMAGIESPQVDARLLLQSVTGLTRSALFLQGDASVDQDEEQAYSELVRQRCNRIPVQHLLGRTEFWSLDFIVTSDVLIPRPETEFVLEHLLSVIGPSSRHYRALDLCTGSGVIAVVLAKELKCMVTATDISPKALVIAQRNIRQLGVTDQVMLIGSDLFSSLAPTHQYDVIVSNPPYIAEGQIVKLAPEVSRREPRIALSGGESGTDIIERIAADAHLYLKPGGWLFLEIGSDQQQVVTDIFRSSKSGYSQVTTQTDWAGRPRVLQARKE